VTASTTETTATNEQPTEGFEGTAHPDVTNGRARVALPPRTPEVHEARAAAAKDAGPVEPAPPTYADMAHIVPR
jgi:hypothetical protein